MQEEKDEEVKKTHSVEADNADTLEEEITLEYVQDYLSSQEFDLSPTQKRISFPLVKRYVKMLRDGKEPPPIKIDNSAIVDGHHRYISGRIHGTEPTNVPWTNSPSTPIGSWALILVVSEDYEQGYDETNFNN
jgi:hypothetical protein